MASALHRSESAPLSVLEAFAAPSAPRRHVKMHTRSHSVSQPFDFLDDSNDHRTVSFDIQNMLLDDDDESPNDTLLPPMEHTDSSLSSSSVSGNSAAQDPRASSPTRPSFGDQRIPRAQPVAPAPSSFGNRPPTQPSLPSFGQSRRHPGRSVSSIELAAIMNGSSKRSHGISAVPAAAPSFSSVHERGHSQQPASDKQEQSNGGKSTGSNWPKTVFDMIQDDFPRTPSPMLSSMLVTSKSVMNAKEMRSSLLNSRIPAAERRSRAVSSAALDLDFGASGKSSDEQPGANDLDNIFGATDDFCGRPSSGRRHHRRSASINWTGDIPGLLEEPIVQPPKRSPLKSSPSASMFPSKQVQVSTSMGESSQSQQHQSAPVASSVDVGHGSPSRASIGGTGNRPPSSAAAAVAATARASSPLNSATKISPRAQVVNHEQDAQTLGQINSNGILNGNPVQRSLHSNFSGAEATVHSPHADPGIPPELGDYNFLYEHPDAQFQVPTPTMQSMHHAELLGTPNPHMQTSVPSMANAAAPYSSAFPGFGIGAAHPSFSNTTNSFGAGSSVPHSYAHTFRDGLAAAGNLKTMSMQMAMFFNAQQQLYAAQMAQMAALTGGSPFNTGANMFNDPSAAAMFGTHMSIPAQGHPHNRSPWDIRDPQPQSQRANGRSRAYADSYRSSNMGHMGNTPKKSDMSAAKSRGARGRRGHRSHDEGGSSRIDRLGMSGNIGGSVLDNHSRSALLEEFRATSLSIGRGVINGSDVSVVGAYGSPTDSANGAVSREWQLAEIKNHVVEFATDQHGSRFIQQKLESSSNEDKKAVLRQALTEAQRLMTDVFGNYVVQKLLDHGGPEAVVSISEELEGRMLSLSLHMYGCRVVQKALEVLEPKARAKLVHELDGHVLKCIRDQNGNHVIQKCVELVESESVQFIVDAVLGQAVLLAGHSYGCRVVQRILEHGAPHQKSPIMMEIMASIPNLIKDQYGNYVIQHVVEHGSEKERSIIMELVRAEVCNLSQHKFASNVVERCLQFGSVGEREVLVDILTVGDGVQNISPLSSLVRDQFGNYVVQRVLDVAKPSQRERVANILKAQVPAIKKYSYGKHIIARLEETLSATNQQYQHQHVNGVLQSQRLGASTEVESVGYAQH